MYFRLRLFTIIPASVQIARTKEKGESLQLNGTATPITSL